MIEGAIARSLSWESDDLALQNIQARVRGPSVWLFANIRGALLLATGAFDLAFWVFGALLTLFGFLASIKSTSERLTSAWLRRRKAKRLKLSRGSASLRSRASPPGQIA